MKKFNLKLLLSFAIITLFFPQDAFPSQENVVKIGVASMMTTVNTYKYYHEMISFIGEQIHQPVQMVHRESYSEMDKLLEKGEVKMAFISSYPYVRDHALFGVEILAVPSKNGISKYNSYIIVHNDSSINSFSELKGKVFAFSDPGSNSGKLYPVYLLKKMGVEPEDFFERSLFSYSYNKSIEMVAKKLVDGAAVESIVYEYMLKNNSLYAKQTRIIKVSPLFGGPPVVVTKDMAPDLKRKLKDAFLNMHKTARGRSILNDMIIDEFVDVPDSDYDSIRDMERFTYDNIKAARNYDSAKDMEHINDLKAAYKTKNRQTIYFGVIPRDNPRIIYEKYQPLMDYLSEKTPYAYELVLKKTYEDTVNAIGNGEMDVALLGPLTYLEAHVKYGVKCILKPKGADGSGRYRSILIAKNDSGIESPSDLNGKSIAFASSKSTSGNLIPRYLLAGAGIHLSDLRGYTNFNYHDSVVKAVLKGQYDAGAVRDIVAQKYMKLGIKPIAESESIPTGPFVAGPGTALSIIENIKKALLQLNPDDSAMKKILKGIDEDLKNGFTEASDEDYSDIRRQINAIPKTCGMGCHPKITL